MHHVFSLDCYSHPRLISFEGKIFPDKGVFLSSHDTSCSDCSRFWRQGQYQTYVTEYFDSTLKLITLNSIYSFSSQVIRVKNDIFKSGDPVMLELQNRGFIPVTIENAWYNTYFFEHSSGYQAIYKKRSGLLTGTLYLIVPEKYDVASLRKANKILKDARKKILPPKPTSFLDVAEQTVHIGDWVGFVHGPKHLSIGQIVRINPKTVSIKKFKATKTVAKSKEQILKLSSEIAMLYALQN